MADESHTTTTTTNGNVNRAIAMVSYPIHATMVLVLTNILGVRLGDREICAKPLAHSALINLNFKFYSECYSLY